MGIDPTISLAFSVSSSPGVYALLLGSGVSRSASIPTGWEIVLDLINILAALSGEDCGPSLETWYREKFGREPSYSALLEELAKSPSERSALLRAYFEPNEREQEEGRKIPTSGYRAISELVALGYIKVIVTTNFDRLLEKALEEKGITPTVLSTTDAIVGAIPIAHSRVVIIKVHGDYLDTRIKNSPSELEAYDEPLNKLLDEIFDNYGLIVCGWSAEWDRALCSALERCKSQRYTTYWTLIGPPTETVKRLIQLRRATDIRIEGADSFFSELKEKVLSLHELNRSHPLSIKVAEITLKKYLSNPGSIIQVHDLVMQEANKRYEEYSTTKYSLETPFNLDVYKSRVLSYETSIEMLQHMLITGCHWGHAEHGRIWAQCLERVNITSNTGSRTDLWDELRHYPSLILLYAGGLSSLIAENYDSFSSLFLLPKERVHNREVPLITSLAITEVLRKDPVGLIFNMERHFVPASDHMQKILREPFREYVPDERAFEIIFDRWEYLYALIYADFLNKHRGRTWGPVGCFLWRNRDEEDHILNIIKNESAALTNDWPILKAGLFNGSYERFEAIRNEYNDFFVRIPHF